MVMLKNHAKTSLNFINFCPVCHPQMTSFAKRNCVHLLYPGEFNLLMTTMSLFEMLLDDAVAESPEDYEKFLISWFQAAMVYSVVWGIGGLLNAHSRDQFDELHRSVRLYILRIFFPISTVL